MPQPLSRAAFLGEQLVEALHALAVATRPYDAALFLDRLARLEALPADALDADARETLALALEARDAHAAELGHAAARGLDLERFAEVGAGLGPDDPEADGWVRDLLLIATLLPWLPGSRRARAEEAVERGLAELWARPRAFLAASALAADRAAHERPEGLGPEAREVLATLAELPLFAAADAVEAPADAGRVARALRAAGAARVEAAEDALADHDLRRSLRRPLGGGPAGLHADRSVFIPLLRMADGVWEVRRRPASLALRWSGPEAEVVVEILQGGPVGPIPVDAEGLYVLPPGDVPLVLELRVGADRRGLRLDPEEAGA